MIYTILCHTGYFLCPYIMTNIYNIDWLYKICSPNKQSTGIELTCGHRQNDRDLVRRWEELGDKIKENIKKVKERMTKYNKQKRVKEEWSCFCSLSCHFKVHITDFFVHLSTRPHPRGILAHSNTFQLSLPAAYAHVCSFQGQSLLCAHCKTSKWPSSAA